MNAIVKYITSHPENCSLLYYKNNEKVVGINEDVRRPLASIYKLIVLLEYLHQCEQEELDPKEEIHFRELKKFWIHWIDSAFLTWYHKVKNKIRKDSIPLSEVVRGMLEQSSNTNTDYLISELGLERINRQIQRHQLDDHDAVIPISTSVLASISETEKDHTPTSLGLLAQEYFEIMVGGEKIEGVDLNLLNDFDHESQCRWSDLLPHASANTYGEVLKTLQHMQKSSNELQNVMKWFSKLKNYKSFKGGMKLGYTPKVFNVALYATDKLGNQYQLVYFLNNLTLEQRREMEYASSEFNVKMLESPMFVDQLKFKSIMEMYDKKIVMFDGDCSFCDSTVSFLFDHNSKRTLYFTSQQSEQGQELLAKHGLSTDLDTIYYYADGKIYEKAQAFFAIAEELDGFWKYFTWLKPIVPKQFANWCYDRIAKRRHLILGKKDTCRLMSQEERQYFLL